MESKPRIVVAENCQALLIPTAVPFMIPSGTMVRIHQDLGGAVTVEVDGNLARIDAKDRYVLGLDNVSNQSNNSIEIDQQTKVATGPVDMEQVWEQLRSCYDPEIPVNVVDLGLIFDAYSQSSAENQNTVFIKMGLTAPACAMGPVIANDIEDKLIQLDNVTKVDVEIVFDPVWSQDRMSEAAKLELGLL